MDSIIITPCVFFVFLIVNKTSSWFLWWDLSWLAELLDPGVDGGLGYRMVVIFELGKRKWVDFKYWFIKTVVTIQQSFSPFVRNFKQDIFI